MNETEKLKLILKNKSILKGSFKLASGKESSYYIDARLTTLDPEGVSIISSIFLDEILKNKDITAVGGPTMGADPIVGSIISLSHHKGNPLNGFLVRKEEKDHGTGKMIEGNINRGDRVAVVEDVVTSGGSVFRAIEAIENFGAKVAKVLVVVDREAGGKELFKERGYELFSIFNVSELL